MVQLVTVLHEGLNPAQSGALDKSARLALGVKTTGVNLANGKGAIVLVDGADAADITKANSVFTNWGTLAVNTDKTSIAADNVDTATITFATLDAEVDYYVTKDGESYSSGTSTPVAGTVTLTLATDEAGLYRVYILRKVINWATGYVDIQAVE